MAIDFSETIALVINNVNSAQFKFPDNLTNLDNIVVVGILVHSADTSKTFEGNNVLSNAIQKKAYLTLNDKNSKALLKRIPLESFFNDQKNVHPLNNLPIDFSKSLVELQDRAGVVAGDAFMFTVFYKYK